MALQKIIFPSSSVTATNFGALFAGVLNDGAIDGLSITYNAGNVGIDTGYLLACGRLIYNNASMTVAVTGPVAQVVLVIDASGTGTLSIDARSAATEGDLSPLIQEDINNGIDTDYELELALVDVSNGTLLRSLGAAKAKIPSGSIGTPELASSSVTPAKLSGVTYSSIGLAADQVRKITVSSSNPTGGSDGDVWLKV